MPKTTVSGFVKRVQTIHRYLSFVTLKPVSDEGWVETRIPFYMNIGQEYVGRMVDIITERVGLFGWGDLEQSIESSNSKDSTRIIYSSVKEINEAYRKIERHHK